LALVLILAIIQPALGHGWLDVPQPRDFQGNTQASASTSGPCGLAGNYPNISTVTAGDVIPVQWTLGGGHDNGAGQKICRFSAAQVDNDQTQFDANILLTGLPCTNNPATATTANVPVNLNPGLWYLQFHWLAGDGSNWYSCAQLQVIGNGGNSGILNEQTLQTVTTRLDESLAENGTTPTFYQIALTPTIQDNFEAILIRFNGTAPLFGTMVNLTAALSLPQVYAAGQYKPVTASPQCISICNVAALTPNIYVSLFPSVGYVGNVSFVAKVYPSEMDFNTRATFNFNTQKGDLYYFNSAAYSQSGIPRRLIVQGSGANAYLSGPFPNCNQDGSISPTPNYCIDLPLTEDPGTDTNTYYYGVYFDGTYQGFIQLQQGDCADYSGVQTLIISLISLLALLLI